VLLFFLYRSYTQITHNIYIREQDLHCKKDIKQIPNFFLIPFDLCAPEILRFSHRLEFDQRVVLKLFVLFSSS